jgi:hypothetical protein
MLLEEQTTYNSSINVQIHWLVACTMQIRQNKTDQTQAPPPHLGLNPNMCLASVGERSWFSLIFLINAHEWTFIHMAWATVMATVFKRGCEFGLLKIWPPMLKRYNYV